VDENRPIRTIKQGVKTMKTEAARTAAAIRKELKAAFPQEQFRVRSRNFAGGDAVDVYVGDCVETDRPDNWGGFQKEPNAVLKQAHEMARKYQYGRFDGMTDCYEYTNGSKDIPQAKYVHVAPFCHAA
jgi:hypothetical protein